MRLSRRAWGIALGAALVASVTMVACAHPREVEDFEHCFLKDTETLAVQPGERPQGGSVQVTFLGTSTLLFDDGETQILVDGFLTRPEKVIGLGREIRTNTTAVAEGLRNAGVDPERLLAVLVAHSHYDHALDVVEIMRRNHRAVLYGSASTMKIAEGGEVPLAPYPACKTQRSEGKACQFDAEDDLEVGKFTVSVLESQHSPPTLLNNDLGDPITTKLKQPARYSAYKEGGSFDFVIERNKHRILVKPSANYVKVPSSKFSADVMFFGTGRLTKQIIDVNYEERVYANTIALVRPQLVVPVHWDDFTKPLCQPLTFPPLIADDSGEALEFIVHSIEATNAKRESTQHPIMFRMLQRYQSIMLFRANAPITASDAASIPLNCPLPKQ